MGRHAARIDTNHTAVVEFFRAHGCAVESLARVGGGLPDLIVGWNSHLAFVEVKSRFGTLTPPQARFLERFPVWIVRNDDQALAVVRWLKARS